MGYATFFKAKVHNRHLLMMLLINSPSIEIDKMYDKKNTIDNFHCIFEFESGRISVPRLRLRVGGGAEGGRATGGTDIRKLRLIQFSLGHFSVTCVRQTAGDNAPHASSQFVSC